MAIKHIVTQGMNNPRFIVTRGLGTLYGDGTGALHYSRRMGCQVGVAGPAHLGMAGIGIGRRFRYQVTHG